MLNSLINFILKGSWLTRLLGIFIILQDIGTTGVALLDSNPATVVDWKLFAVTFAAGWGIAIARQNSKTSEEVGLKTSYQSILK